MKWGEIAHCSLSVLASIASFFLSYGLVQYFVTRNISIDSFISQVGKLVLNFGTARFISGVVYAATFQRGHLMVSAVPATLIGGLLLAIAIAHGEIGGIEGSATLKPWAFAVPVFVGISCGYMGACCIRRIQGIARHQPTRF